MIKPYRENERDPLHCRYAVTLNARHPAIKLPREYCLGTYTFNPRTSVIAYGAGLHHLRRRRRHQNPIPVAIGPLKLSGTVLEAAIGREER
jgi:hypothetical protein